MALPNGANEGLVNGSGWMLTTVDTDRSGKSGMVKQTIIYDQQGGTNKLTFVEVQQNKGVDDGKFKFAPPAGTHILSPPK